MLVIRLRRNAIFSALLGCLVCCGSAPAQAQSTSTEPLSAPITPQTSPLNEAGATNQERLRALLAALRESSATLADEVGPSTAGPKLQVDVDLLVSTERPVVGELWTVFGEIKNRSEQPIWIVDRFTTLSVPPEVWGSTSQGGSIPAFLPTLGSRAADEIVRIEPNNSYVVTWKVDSWRSDDKSESFSGWRAVGSRLGVTVRDFLFYRPGEYSFSSVIHVWPNPPKGNGLSVLDTGSTFTVTRTKQIHVENSPWILIIGAMIGGLIAFSLRFLFTLTRASLKTLGGIRYLFLGPAVAILLCTVGTVLISRLRSADFLVSIQVRDIWGAVASGFVLQWLGLAYFSQRLTGLLSDKPTGSGPAPIAGESVADAPADSPPVNENLQHDAHRVPPGIGSTQQDGEA